MKYGMCFLNDRKSIRHIQRANTSILFVIFAPKSLDKSTFFRAQKMKYERLLEFITIINRFVCVM